MQFCTDALICDRTHYCASIFLKVNVKNVLFCALGNGEFSRRKVISGEGYFCTWASDII